MGQDGGGASMRVCKEVTEGEAKTKGQKKSGQSGIFMFL